MKFCGILARCSVFSAHLDPLSSLQPQWGRSQASKWAGVGGVSAHRSPVTKDPLVSRQRSEQRPRSSTDVPRCVCHRPSAWPTSCTITEPLRKRASSTTPGKMISLLIRIDKMQDYFNSSPFVENWCLSQGNREYPAKSWTFFVWIPTIVRLSFVVKLSRAWNWSNIK